MITKNKVCVRCGKLKTRSILSYHKKSDGRDGFNPVCKICVNSKSRLDRKNLKLRIVMEGIK